MKFGEAITLLNAGHPVTRQGWNGKGMFLIKAGGYTVEASKVKPNGPINAEFLERRGLTHLEILPHIDMWTVNAIGRQAYLPGWLASQSDMLADDWMMYVEPPVAGPTLKEVAPVKKPHWTQTPEGKKKMAARKRRGARK
jgi:hypothetical protein